MPRPHYGFGSRYKCPGCGKNVEQGAGYKRLGPFSLHPQCRVSCHLCGEGITPPPVGKAHTVAAFNGDPVHAACKKEATS